MVSSIERFKRELRLLEKRFSNDHPTFRIWRWTVDHIEMEFIQMDGESHNITADLFNNGSSVVWSSESEKLQPLLSKLTNAKCPSMDFIDKIHTLISKLCENFYCPKPSELRKFGSATFSNGNESDNTFECLEEECGSMSVISCGSASSTRSSPSSEKDEEAGSEFDQGGEDEDDIAMKSDSDDEFIYYQDNGERGAPSFKKIPEECRALLESMKKRGSGPVYELDRIMLKELRELYLSEEYASGMFTFDFMMHGDGCRELAVKLYKGYGNKFLNEITPAYMTYLGTDFLYIRMVYTTNYPLQQMTTAIYVYECYYDHQYILVTMNDWLPSMTTKDVLTRIANSSVEPVPLHIPPDPLIPTTWGFSLRVVEIPKPGGLGLLEWMFREQRRIYDVIPEVGFLNYILLTFFLFVGIDLRKVLEINQHRHEDEKLQCLSIIV